MEISNSLNQPVTFYTKNTGNSINMAIDEDNSLMPVNVFSNELNKNITAKKSSKTTRKKRKNKRLNTIDSEYFMDESITINEIETKDDNNFFINTEQNKIKNNIKKIWENFTENTPLINYFFLKEKKLKIQKTVQTLNDISKNVDELINTSVPYGEEKTVYSDIAKNLTEASKIMNKKTNLNIY